MRGARSGSSRSTPKSNESVWLRSRQGGVARVVVVPVPAHTDALRRSVGAAMSRSISEVLTMAKSVTDLEEARRIIERQLTPQRPWPRRGATCPTSKRFASSLRASCERKKRAVEIAAIIRVVDKHLTAREQKHPAAAPFEGRNPGRPDQARCPSHRHRARSPIQGSIQQPMPSSSRRKAARL